MFSGGCGETGPRRVPIYGMVQQAGSPVPGGILSLLPAEGHHGPAVTAAIENGRYELDETNGPVAGPHKLVVVLEAGDKMGFLREKSTPSRPSPGSAGRFEFHVEVPEEGPFEHNVTLD